ncbi:MAG: NADH-quinone oxidoreductase subunit A [Calditrichaeota bacterium]|nr:NADH-quinone oxidoreductase subunit A [Calditrichota bacterium]
MSNYTGVLFLMIAAVGLTAIIILLTRLLGPRRTNPAKELPFETGNLPTPGTTREGFPIHFYVVSILFVVFDVEIAFLYPWAVNFKALGLFGLVEMGVFLLILLAGWYFIIKRGVLQWR